MIAIPSLNDVVEAQRYNTDSVIIAHMINQNQFRVASCSNYGVHCQMANVKFTLLEPVDWNISHFMDSTLGTTILPEEMRRIDNFAENCCYLFNL
jgi:hypothetical protein